MSSVAGLSAVDNLAREVFKDAEENLWRPRVGRGNEENFVKERGMNECENGKLRVSCEES